ncbi:hypothetical protein [Streptomyces sp. NPDC051636]|uniref:hypothetical protein n=1 Tax=Streptomyces sp. NPDC051636 TaxID=3365663 RepID=UPI0037A04DF2
MGLSLAGAAAGLATVDGMPGRLKVAIIVCLTALLVPLLAWSSRSATVISRECVTVKGLRRAERTAWRDIQGIEIEPGPGSRPRMLTVMYDRQGRRTALPHLDDRNVASLEDEVLVLRAQWEGLRGEDWQPVQRVVTAQGLFLDLAGAVMVGLTAALTAIMWSVGVFVVLLISGVLEDAEDYGPPLSVLLSAEMLLIVPALAFAVTTIRAMLRRER